MTSKCPKRVTRTLVDTIPVNGYGLASVYVERQLPHDWRDAIVSGYQVCGACSAIRKREVIA